MPKMACKIPGCPNTMTHSAYLVRPICTEHWAQLPPGLQREILQARHEGPRAVAAKLTEAKNWIAKEKADGVRSES